LNLKVLLDIWEHTFPLALSTVKVTGWPEPPPLSLPIAHAGG
jgi:hypothetical protein